MMELERVVFHAAHLDVADLDLREFDGVGYNEDTKERIAGMADLGVAMTLMWDGRIVGFTGFFPLWKGVVEVWLIPTKYVGLKPLLLVRTLSRYIEGIVEDHKLHRVQSTAIDSPIHTRFFECLGFECEGIAKDFSKRGIDHRYWARRYK